MNKNIDIGTKIKKYRKDKKYTLKMLSEQTGLSIGFLSQLERGMTTIAIDSLANVARVLGVELADFFESDTKAGSDPVTHGYDMPMTQIGPEIIQYTQQECRGIQPFPKIVLSASIWRRAGKRTRTVQA